MSDLDPAVVERMVALVRKAQAGEDGKNTPIGQTGDFWNEAREIAEMLPEPDMAEVHALIRMVYPRTRRPDGTKMSGEGPARVEAILAGRGDDYWEVRLALAALERGRALAQRDAER